jgi:predicted Zn-dependent protease
MPAFRSIPATKTSGTSGARWAVRGLLALVLVGLLWIVYRNQVRNTPDYHWSRAQAALKANNLNAAKVNLQNLIQRFPQDPRGHQAMAQLMVQEAKLPAGALGYAAFPAAFNSLVEAAKLKEDDLELQKLVVKAGLLNGHAQDAAAAAQRVLKVEPKHADSLFARAWRAAENRDGPAALRLLDQLPAEEQNRFRALGLRAQVLQNGDPKSPQLQAALDGIAARAAQFTPAEVQALPPDEVNILARLLPAAVHSAPDVGVAYRRAEAALSVAEHLQAGPATSSTATSSTAEQPATVRVEIGRKMVAQVSAVLNAKYPALTLSADMQPAQQRFAERLQKILPVAPPTDAKTATDLPAPDLLVAHEAALLKFNQGEFATAVQILEQALSPKKPNKRVRPEETQSLHLLAARALLGLRRHREAKVHVSALLTDKRTSGMGQLLMGAIASAEGRHQDALDFFVRAERELGDNPLVLISLAQTHLALAQWEESLPYLAALHEALASDDAELQAWAKQQQFTEARIHLQEARALLALDRKADADKHLLALTGSELEPQAALLEAEHLAKKKNPAGADAILATALQKFPQDAGLVAYRAKILRNLKRDEDLATLLTNSAAASPADLRMQLMVARELVSSGKGAEALQALTTLEQQHPGVIPIQLLKVDALLQQGKMAEAKEVVEQIQNQPNAAALGGMLGAVLALRAQDPQAAAAALSASVKEAPDNLQIRHLEAELAAVSGDYPAAIADLGESIRVTSLRGRAGPLLCYCVAKLAEKQGPAAAAAALTPLVSSLPDEPFVLIAHSDALAMQGMYQESLKQLDRLEQVDAKSALAPYLKGVVLSRTGDLKLATSEVLRAIALDDKYVPALTLAAQLQLAQKQPAEALQHIEAAIARAPQAWNLVLLKTEILGAAGQPEEALKVARALTTSFPELVEARRHLVNLQLRSGQPESLTTALADCRAAREKFTTDEALAVQEILLLELLGKSEESRQLAEQYVGTPARVGQALAVAQGFASLQRLPLAREWAEVAMTAAKPEEKPVVQRFLGMVVMSQHAQQPDRKLLAEARDLFAAVLDKHPDDFVSGNNLAWLLAVDFDQPAEAVKIAERARAAAPVDKLPTTFVDTMAVVYRRAGEFSKAANLLEGALNAHPEENLFKLHLGLTLGQIDRLDEAKQLLNEALAARLSPQQTTEAQQELKRIADVEAAAAAEAEAKAEAKAAEAEAKAEAKRQAKQAAEAETKAVAPQDKTKPAENVSAVDKKL